MAAVGAVQKQVSKELKKEVVDFLSKRGRATSSVIYVNLPDQLKKGLGKLNAQLAQLERNRVVKSRPDQIGNLEWELVRAASAGKHI